MIVTSYQEKALKNFVQAFYPWHTEKEINNMNIEMLVDFSERALKIEKMLCS
ncbi:MAG: hypothetical protein ACOC1K_05305 [Nanoarchaeota archaeon]